MLLLFSYGWIMIKACNWQTYVPENEKISGNLTKQTWGRKYQEELPRCSKHSEGLLVKKAKFWQ